MKTQSIKIGRSQWHGNQKVACHLIWTNTNDWLQNLSYFYVKIWHWLKDQSKFDIKSRFDIKVQKTACHHNLKENGSGLPARQRTRQATACSWGGAVDSHGHFAFHSSPHTVQQVLQCRRRDLHSTHSSPSSHGQSRTLRLPLLAPHSPASAAVQEERSTLHSLLPLLFRARLSVHSTGTVSSECCTVHSLELRYDVNTRWSERLGGRVAGGELRYIFVNLLW